MILKWPGGKKWLLKEVSHLIPQKINNYIEPFVGGGSFFFALTQQDKFLPSYIQKGYLSDTNQKLINFYSELKLDPAKLYRNSIRLINITQKRSTTKSEINLEKTLKHINLFTLIEHASTEFIGRT